MSPSVNLQFLVGMKKVACLIWALWVNLAVAQNYADSVRHIFASLESEDISDKEKRLLDTLILDLTPVSDDSSLLVIWDVFIEKSNDFRVWYPINELSGNVCKRRLESILSPDQQSFYLRYYGDFLSVKAHYFNLNNDKQKGLELSYKALEIRQQLKDTALIVGSLISLGISHFNEKDYEQAENWWRQASDLQKVIGDSIGLNETYGYLGAAVLKHGKPAEAISYFQLSLASARKEKDWKSEAMTLESLGMAYSSMKDFQQAKKCFSESLVLVRKRDDIFMLSSILSSLAKVSVDLKQWDDALAYAQEAYDVGQKNAYINLRMNAASALVEVYRAMGRYKESLEMYEEFNEIFDSVHNERNAKVLAELKAEFELKQEVAIDSMANAIELENQIATNKRQKTQSYFLVAGLLFTAIIGLVLWGRVRLTRRQKRIIENEKRKLDLANEQLQELDNAKSRFFTNISHEFRTPMTVILGMLDQVEQQPDVWLEKGVPIIRRNSRQVLNLINQILDLRKLESGKLEVSLTQGNIIPFLSYLLESFQSLAEQKGIRLSFESEIDEVLMKYDPEKVLVLVSNLLSNAIKFTPKGGTVKLEVLGSRLNVLSQEPKTSNLELKTLTVAISDTGRGIPTEKLPHIFDRFYQVDDSTTREGEGTGIGLTLVREIVQVLGGEISVKSEVGKGSQFTFTLPIIFDPAIASEDQVEIEIPQSHVQEKETLLAPLPISADEELPSLLIAEDNEDVIQYLVACLQDHYQLLITRNGQEGIDQAIAEVPDLILSDVMMPLKDGFELCETLKNDERTSHIPIVLLTAKADVESRISGWERGADAYLAKPFDQPELLAVLKKLLMLRQKLQARYQSLEATPPSEDIAIKQEDVFVQKVRAAVEARLDDETFKVPELCRVISMSRTQLHNKVKALTVKSTSLLIRSIRLQKAKELLQTSDLNISEVAYEVGIGNLSYFSRLFAEEFGERPSEVKK